MRSAQTPSSHAHGGNPSNDAMWNMDRASLYRKTHGRYPHVGFEWIQHHRMDDLKRWLTGAPLDAVNAKTRESMTMGHIAAIHGNHQGLQMWCDAGGDYRAVDMRGHTIPHAAVSHVTQSDIAVACVNTWIRAGGSLSAISTSDDLCAFPIHAVRHGHYDIVSLCVSHGVDIGCFMHGGMESVGHVAAYHGHLRILDLWRDHGGDIHGCIAPDGMTIGHRAAQGNQSHVLQWWLDHGGSRDATMLDGSSIGMIAYESDAMHAMSTWIRHGGNLLEGVHTVARGRSIRHPSAVRAIRDIMKRDGAHPCLQVTATALSWHMTSRPSRSKILASAIQDAAARDLAMRMIPCFDDPVVMAAWCQTIDPTSTP